MARERPRAGYLGPAGTFSEEALLASAEPDAVEPWPLPTIAETVSALRSGAADFAVVPIENSLEGSITATLDLLAGEAGDVQVVGEALLRVRHSLIAHSMVALADIRTVLTHPQVPGQCAGFLARELPRAQVLPASSTAEAVRVVVEAAEPGQAAIGTELAASIYGGTVVRAGIEDSDDNETRFVWLARADHRGEAPLRAQEQAESRTSLLFWGRGADRPGWLVRCLDEFARRDINLTKIESRPRRRELGSYMFFADLSGRADDEAIAQAIAGLARECEHVRVLGSYRAARRQEAG